MILLSKMKSYFFFLMINQIVKFYWKDIIQNHEDIESMIILNLIQVYNGKNLFPEMFLYNSFSAIQYIHDHYQMYC